MIVRELLAEIDRLAPFALAESWDNVGLQVGSATAEVRHLLVTLEVDEATLAAARRQGCEAVLAHHPLVFTPLSAVSDETPVGRVLLRAAAAGVTVVVAHTNLDKATGGLADVICAALGLEDPRPLVPAALDWCKLVGFVPEGDLETVRQAIFAAGAGEIGKYAHCSWTVAGQGTFVPQEGARPTVGTVGRPETSAELRLEAVFPRRLAAAVTDAFVAAHSYEEPAFDVYAIENQSREQGLGRVGTLAAPQPLGRLAADVAALFHLPHVRFSGDAQRPVQRVACLPGSGGSLVAAAAGVADVLVTGDIKYHQAREAAGLGLALIELPHEVAEEEALERWSEGFADVLASKGVEVEFQRREPGVWALSGEPVAHERTHNHEDDHVHLYVDGGARGNPGPAGIGARLLTADGDLVEELADYIGEATNNVAEYQALVAGLQMALDHRVRRLTVFADSELVVKQLNGQYRVKDAVLRGFHDQASRLLHQIADVEVRHIPREQNAEADRLVNQAIDGAAG